MVRGKPRVYIDPSLRRQLNIMAAKCELTQNEVLEEAIRLGLKQLENDLHYPERIKGAA